MTFINKENNLNTKEKISSISTSSTNKISNAINTNFAVASNLIPHFWYYKIVNKQGTPDLPCIMILSELFGWFRNLKKSRVCYSNGLSTPELVNGKLAISYEFLSKKLNFQKERIRRNIVKLETLSVINRDIRNITLRDGSRVNQLYISINPSFFQSCFKNRDTNMIVQRNKTEFLKENSIKESPLPRGDLIFSSNKTSNTRSISNKKILRLEDNKRKFTSTDIFSNVNQEQKIDTEAKAIYKETNDFSKRYKQLKDFYPISLEDCYSLQKSSGRQFSLNAMNEILKNMSKRLADRIFYSKKGFLSYMSKVFKYEKRDAQKTNSSNFKIVSNLSDIEQKRRIQEKYLSDIESSRRAKPEDNLKRKLSSVLDRSKAYELLTAYKKMEIKNGEECCIFLNKSITLSKIEETIILSQVQATLNCNVNKDTLINIKSIKFLSTEKNINLVKKARARVINNSTEESKKITTWEKIKTIFARSIGQDGDAINKNWLSKLEVEINEVTKTVNLQASRDFVKDFIEERYIFDISRVINHIGFKLGEFTCKTR